jgi:hypothetical protein
MQCPIRSKVSDSRDACFPTSGSGCLVEEVGLLARLAFVATHGCWGFRPPGFGSFAGFIAALLRSEIRDDGRASKLSERDGRRILLAVRCHASNL